MYFFISFIALYATSLALGWVVRVKGSAQKDGGGMWGRALTGFKTWSVWQSSSERRVPKVAVVGIISIRVSA